MALYDKEIHCRSWVLMIQESYYCEKIILTDAVTIFK